MATTDEPGVTIRDLLIAARKKRGWSQERLAREIVVSDATVKRWHRKTRPQIPDEANVAKLAAALPLDGEFFELVEASRPRPQPKPEDFRSLHVALLDEHRQTRSVLQAGLSSVENRLLTLIEEQSKLLAEQSDLLAQMHRALEALTVAVTPRPGTGRGG